MTEKIPRPIDMGSHLTSVYVSSISLLSQSYILGPTIFLDQQSPPARHSRKKLA